MSGVGGNPDVAPTWPARPEIARSGSGTALPVRLPATSGLPGAIASMGHEDGKLGVAENVIGNAPGQRLSERALRVGPHHEKVGAECCRLVEDHIAQAAVTEFRLDQCWDARRFWRGQGPTGTNLRRFAQ